MSQTLHRFVLERLAALLAPGARVLDFGAGDGALVSELRDAGFDAAGVDVAIEGMTARSTGQVHRMSEGRIPFPDDYFDAVCANQVFEHVGDLALALSEVRRVLRPGGTFLNLFPSVGVIREGHCGIAMAHWLQRWPRAQRVWLQVGRSFGFGYFSDGRSCAEWAAHMGDYLQRFTIYRPERILIAEHRRHFSTLERREELLAALFLAQRSRLAAAVQHELLRRLTRVAVRRMGGMVIIATRSLPLVNSDAVA